MARRVDAPFKKVPSSQPPALEEKKGRKGEGGGTDLTSSEPMVNVSSSLTSIVSPGMADEPPTHLIPGKEDSWDKGKRRGCERWVEEWREQKQRTKALLPPE